MWLYHIEFNLIFYLLNHVCALYLVVIDNSRKFRTSMKNVFGRKEYFV